MKWLLALLLVTNLAYADSTYYVYNQTKKEKVYEQNIAEQRPIASVTKLMTALVVVESNPVWVEKIKYKGNIFFSRQVSKKELFESLLIRSDNNAANAFANAWPGGYDAFIATMNARAASLGMAKTHFDDPSGLDKDNVSTAEDLVKLIAEAGKHDVIRYTSSSKYLHIEEQTKRKIKSVSLNNTNKQLLFEFDEIVMSKTGFTNPAGRCLALLVDKNGTKYSIVILGEKSISSREKQARHLIKDYVSIQEADKDFK